MTSADENYLRQISEAFGVQDPPIIDVVEEVSPGDQLERVVSCMQEAGWADVHVENDGIRYPRHADDPDQRQAIGLALYTCYARFPVTTEFLHPTDAMCRRLYDYFTDELAPCLRSHGYDISPAPPWEHWLHALRQDQEYWDPSLEVPRDEYPKDACPHMPPEFR